jgi:hypothetical protein
VGTAAARHRVASRRVWLAIACLAVIVAVLVRSNAAVLVDSIPRLQSFHAQDDGTLAITVAVPPRSWTRVTDVLETSSEIRVTIESLNLPVPLPGTGHLELRELVVELASPLDERTVVDAHGMRVPDRP